MLRERQCLARCDRGRQSSPFGLVETSSGIPPSTFYARFLAPSGCVLLSFLTLLLHCRGERSGIFTMARLGRLGFLGVAVVFHVVYILSIFDIYFKSPIVSGMRAYSVGTAKAPAKRLVLYVGTSPARQAPSAYRGIG